MFKIIAGTIGAIVLLVAIVLGGWEIGWWFKKQNTNRDAEVTRQSYGFQQTYREEVVKDMRDISDITSQIQRVPASQVPALKAQRLAIAGQMCSQASNLRGSLDPTTQDYIAASCIGGTVNPNSELTR